MVSHTRLCRWAEFGPWLAALWERVTLAIRLTFLGNWSFPFEGWFADAPIRMDPKCLSIDRTNHRTKRPWPTILLNWDSRTNVQNTESVLTCSQEKPGREKPEWRPAIRRHCLIRPNEGFFLKRFPRYRIFGDTQESMILTETCDISMDKYCVEANKTSKWMVLSNSSLFICYEINILWIKTETICLLGETH